MKQKILFFLLVFSFFYAVKSIGQNYSQNDPRTHNYAYDKIGNLTKDEQGEIEEIVWNAQGKMAIIIRTPLSKKPDLYFKYDGLGNRVSKTAVYPYSINGLIKLTTYYIYDPWGNVISVYERRYFDTGKEEYAQVEQHIHNGTTRMGVRKMNLILATDEGPVEHDLTKSERVLGEKNYELTSPTGNVLAVVSDKKLADNEPDVKAVYDYYPFGMIMPGRTFNGAGYRFGFTGHEKLDEITGSLSTFYSTETRLYDARLGIWRGVDELFTEYPSWSSYNYSTNNPMRMSDPDGRGAFDKIAGSIIGTFTNIAPGSSFLRDQYEPDDDADYNNALQAADVAAMAAGATMVAGGGSAVVVGTGMVAFGGGVAATVIGAPEGGVIALDGAIVIAQGKASMAVGGLLMASTASNASQGYDRGKKSNNSSSNSSSSSSKGSKYERVTDKEMKKCRKMDLSHTTINQNREEKEEK